MTTFDTAFHDTKRKERPPDGGSRHRRRRACRRALRQRKERLGSRRRLGDLRKGAEGTRRYLHRGPRRASLADSVRRVSRGAEQNPDRSGRPAAGLSSSFPGRTRAAEPHERSLRK